MISPCSPPAHKVHKRKRVVLKLKDKINIIESLKKGESGRELADKYGVGTSTISDIKKNANAIMEFACKLVNQHRKVMKTSKYELLEEAMYCWFLQKQSTGETITGPLFCAKALEFNKKLGGDESFAASNGWLYRFKSRHKIREVEIQDDNISAGADPVNKFKCDFKKKLTENDYDLDFVYNADETVLYWRTLPSKCYPSQRENLVLKYAPGEERLTILICANATGSHKLPVLLVAKYLKHFKKPRVSLNYRYQRRSYVCTDIFMDWYDNIFIPEVKKYQNEIGKQGNVLLLLDNAPIHPLAEQLERENGKFKAIFLPANVTSMLQPMAQRVPEILKGFYRRQLIRILLCLNGEDLKTVLTSFQDINFKECCYMVVYAWNWIERNTLIKAWDRILMRENENSINNTDDSTLKDLRKVMSDLQICKKCNDDDIINWLSCDSNDLGFQLLSDDEIVDAILQINEVQAHATKVNEMQANEVQEKQDETEENVDGENDAGPSHAEACQALETALQWFEKQTECDGLSLIQLTRIRDLAAMKRDAGSSHFN